VNRLVGLIGLVVAITLLTPCSSPPGAPQNSSTKPVSANPPQPIASASLKKPASSLYFLDSKTGWVLVNDNLYATVDAGASWKKLNRDALSNCDKVVFASKSAGWLLCDRWTTRRRSNSVFSTADGGRSWQQVLEVPSPIYALHLLSENVGYVSSRWQPLQKTVNGGKQWTKLDGIEGLNYVDFVDEKSAWGYGGAVWRTSDGGETWKQKVSYDQVKDLWTGSFIDANTGWIIGGDQLWRTIDGEKWQRVNGVPQQGELVDVDFVSAKEGWLATNDGSLLHSVDGGATWQLQTKLPNAGTIRFLTNLNGWVLGSNGELLRSDDGGQTWRSVSL
jgi:photosystem II stability/assembly factor-like uncharacterized protein